MGDGADRRRVIIERGSVPNLPRYVKLRHDKARDRWVLLAPERILTPNAVAVDVVRRCDGKRSVEAIAGELAEDYDAAVEDIIADIIEMLQDLADKGYIRA
ncbi:MAG: pyrroloquinoline quinone biosynthesis peptide chaperone PqqD [Hyphomicrobiaceae bacterium]